MKDDFDQPCPLVNGRIVATNYNPVAYHSPSLKRGRADFVMSRSQLAEFANCPDRWHLGYQEEEESKEALRWGSLIDTMLLQPDQFAARYVVHPDNYPAPKAPTGEKPWHNGADYCKDWNAKQNGKTAISSDYYRDAQEAVSRMMGDEHIRTVLQNCDRQVYVIAEYHDKETKVVIPLKALIDIVPNRYVPFYGKALIDLKTARSAHPVRWQYTVFERSYHTQAAIYLDVYRAATNEDRTDFLHLVQENVAPWQPGKRLLSVEYVELGRQSYLEALRRYAQCIKTGRWPGYDEEQQSISGWTIVHPKERGW